MLTRWPLLFTALTAVTLAAAALWLVFDTSVTRSEAAAWFQAIGGVLAVVAALVIAWSQERRANAAEARAERAELQSDLRLIEALIGLSTEARASMGAMRAEAQIAVDAPGTHNAIHNGRSLLMLNTAFVDARESIDRLLRGRVVPAEVALGATRIVRIFTPGEAALKKMSPKVILGLLDNKDIALAGELDALRRASQNLLTEMARIEAPFGVG